MILSKWLNLTGCHGNIKGTFFETAMRRMKLLHVYNINLYINRVYYSLHPRPVATYLKVVRRKSERVPNLVSVGWESTKGDIPSLGSGVRGTSPEQNFDLWLPLCALSMHFLCVLGQNFSSLGLIWNRWYLHIYNGTLT